MNGPRHSSRSERERDWGGGCWDRATFTICSCCVYLKEKKCTESVFKKIPEWSIFAWAIFAFFLHLTVGAYASSCVGRDCKIRNQVGPA